MQDFLWQAFVTLLVVMNPFAVMPMFVNLTRNETPAVKRRVAIKSCALSGFILLSFGIAGDKLLDVMSISEPAFRIAGGFLLLLVSLDMVMAKSQSGFRSTTSAEKEETLLRDDISVFPLAIPMIAGPGVLTSLVVLMRQAEVISPWMTLGICIILVIMICVMFSSFLLGDRLMSLLGVTGTNVLTRIFGVILSALAVQGMLTGIVLVIRSI